MSAARRFATLAVVAATAAALAGCGGPTVVVEQDVPVAVAEQVPLEGSGLTAPAGAAPSAEESPEAPSDSVDSGDSADSDAAEPPAPATPAPPAGPTAADAAAFVAGGAEAGLDGAEHVVVDLDGDGWSEVVVTGTQERVGVVRIAWWTSRGYQVLVSDEAGPGRDVLDLRAADLNEDDRTEVLVVVEGERRRSLAVWSVVGPGELERLEADGGCNDGRHVFGVTTARLQSSGEGPPAIVADCDESPLPVADWSEHRWVWEDGSYRHVEGEGEDEDRPGRGQGNGEGRGGDDDSGDGTGENPGNSPGDEGDSDQD